MQLHIDSVCYDVIASDELLYFNRQEVWSICEHDSRQLLISPRATPQMLERIVHEAKRRIEIHLAREKTQATA